MKVTFRLNNDADVCGTCRQSEITASYSRLVELFGEPIESDGYKVSGEWSFESENGDVVTLYDWKSTHLYDCDYPTVSQFRDQSSAEFNIGGTDKTVAAQFKAWLTAQL
jgi:hypothetical protein